MLYHSCGNKIRETKDSIVNKTPGRSKDGTMIGNYQLCPHCKRILRPQDCTETYMLIDLISKISIKNKEIGQLIINSIGKLSESWI